ncbi:MAG: UDP-N-acetylglucosamine 1-carboxyvinyltransferase [Candidatus Taylorbacteria bacterium RIFCSPLOWO2_12_FULL_43_20]|uniref:UDP-N-acetylglucosamine 1-carboxyvinyltransferase n=1 Tax=Candidatus Taylorbacteria bacterium RIFCSPLOWO2_12_FULL_43_20 TaxID=1802332 RepID=A0A1G2P307_9BACT|nr:MAG: UDP-N-acetylglucosamine 1-carboxyvinyltransferase [Candidatus Taylorbacteria bacterium RIFCSPHIGHO2_01_FULL_43_120]OHA24200.1 MAG: UDP-N-acetylglucosamine 1-carboxyvinyltransferase [Candidatus Taylorbacteria bacterium RIFCSPHIGHO2_02_FULL_43_55]OHA28153.1 MAG: UDP-N-acetylglucosamine 1-carboxyvinyltransferase [Candidatus Taylorbacteria bacterium RIFCSPHIGHO2_12_FULL_42_34]OHA32179.1 MAG: UDP-N-acetylglucosamine 1-carboxyvinyltransferase [Candidatus Taylorbacteria bacterium RIFCSPLOWO2_01
MNKLQPIAKLIKELREERGITQSQFADKLGTTQSVVARFENGEQNFSAEMLLKISDALEKNVIKVADRNLSIKIEGGRKLKGTVSVKNSKNGAVAVICAALLNDSRSVIKNVPKIEEVYRLVEVLESIGVAVKWAGNDLEITPPDKFEMHSINIEAAAKIRSIILLVGPLLHKMKKFSIPLAGGCTLGSRTVRPHFFALENLGIKIEARDNEYLISRGKLVPAEIVLYESGDTVTENVIMAAALIPGQTTIKMASANYQIQELCFFLETIGVKIEGVGTTTLHVHGKQKISEKVEYYLSEDPIESMFFISAAIVTNSSILIKRCPIEFLELELLKLEKMGFKYTKTKPYKSMNGKTDLVDIKTAPSKLTALTEKIAPRPFPGLNMDNLPFFAVMATQAKGETLIHDWPYEKRAFYYKELDKLGADTTLLDPHRIMIKGPVKLKANEIVSPPALRPAAIILVAMLGAEGVSILRNIYSINRGYEDMVARLNKLGAKITILRDL